MGISLGGEWAPFSNSDMVIELRTRLVETCSVTFDDGNVQVLNNNETRSGSDIEIILSYGFILVYLFISCFGVLSYCLCCIKPYQNFQKMQSVIFRSDAVL